MHRRVLRAFRSGLLLFPLPFLGNIVALSDICPSCKRTYPDFTRLAIHCALEHELWLCPKCPKTFPVENKKAYWLHRMEKHKEVVCFACNLRVFSDKNEWQRHRKKHEEKVLSLLDNFPCCPQMPEHAETVWVRELHAAHRHGSWIDFLCKVRPLHKCCEPFRNAVFEAYFSKRSKKTLLEGMRDFSRHVYEKHGLCFFCERKLDNTDMFGCQKICTDFFLRPRGNMFSLKMKSFSCFCGKRTQRNAASRLFALKIDRLPFGTGLDTVTHPFYCIVDDGKNEKEAQPEKLKAVNVMPSKSDANPRKYLEEPKENFLKPQSPSLSIKSVDTTLTSIDDKKYKKLPAFDDNLASPTDNEINVK